VELLVNLTEVYCDFAQSLLAYSMFMIVFPFHSTLITSTVEIASLNIIKINHTSCSTVSNAIFLRYEVYLKWCTFLAEVNKNKLYCKLSGYVLQHLQISNEAIT